MAVVKIDLTCPKCGGNMERDAEHKMLRCPYCGHGVFLQTTDPGSIEANAYARQKGILHANAEARRARKRNLLKAAAVIVGVLIALMIAVCAVVKLQPKVDPFAYITVSFSGNTGDGTAEVTLLETAEGNVDPQKITYRVTPRYYPSEGDVVTVTAESLEYPLSPTSKTYRVEGLDTCLTDLNGLSDEAVEMIHNKSEMTVAKAVEGAGIAIPVASTEPCMMYLATDGRDRNELYDVYLATYPEKDGGFAERYVVIYYTNIIVRDTQQPTMSYDGTMYQGQVIETLDKGYGGFMTGYRSLKDVKADILAHQTKAITLQERDCRP